jgi:spore coat protein U-like protein
LINYLFHASVAFGNCSFSEVSPVSFGVYDVFSESSNNNGIGSITIKCHDKGSSYKVQLSTGQSNTYSTRVMISGTNRMNYNLYTSASRTLVWGDGTEGSSEMGLNKNSKSILNIFGKIPANQDLAVGIYFDNIVVTVEF